MIKSYLSEKSGTGATARVMLLAMLTLWIIFATACHLQPKTAAAAPVSSPAHANACYWMENVSGRYEWVPAETGGMYSGEGFERCFALDSCDGGLGHSSGGCYKWSAGATGTPVPWGKK